MVWRDRIGVIGVCGGGGYVLNATLTEKRIKAVVAITPVNVGRLFREGFSNYDPLGALDAMAAQRTKEARGGELQVNELLPASPEAAKANGMTERDIFEARIRQNASSPTISRVSRRTELCRLRPGVGSVPCTKHQFC